MFQRVRRLQQITEPIGSRRYRRRCWSLPIFIVIYVSICIGTASSENVTAFAFDGQARSELVGAINRHIIRASEIQIPSVAFDYRYRRRERAVFITKYTQALFTVWIGYFEHKHPEKPGSNQ